MWRLLGGATGSAGEVEKEEETEGKTWGKGSSGLCEGKWSVRVFLYFFLMLSKLPPPGFELKAAIYRQNIFSGFKIGPLKFCVWPLISINSLGKN